MSWKLSSSEIASQFRPNSSLDDVNDKDKDDDVVEDDVLTMNTSWDGLDDLESNQEFGENENDQFPMPSKNIQMNQRKNPKSKQIKQTPYTKKEKNLKVNKPPTASAAARPPQRGRRERGVRQNKRYPNQGPRSAATSVASIWQNPVNGQAQAQVHWMPHGNQIAVNRPLPQTSVRISTMQHSLNNQEQFLMQGNELVRNIPAVSVQPPPAASVQNPAALSVVPILTRRHSQCAQPQRMNIKRCYLSTMTTDVDNGNLKIDSKYHPRTAELISVTETQWQHSLHWMLDLFGVHCFDAIYDECQVRKCNHSISDFKDVFNKLLHLSADSLLITYGLLRRHQFLFLLFAECFANAFSKRNLHEDLLHLLADCRLYKSQSARIVGLTFRILKNNGWELEAMACIMEYLWVLPSKAHKYKDLTYKILQLLASSYWYSYTDQLSDLLKTGFNLPSEISAAIIASTKGSVELRIKAAQILGNNLGVNTELQSVFNPQYVNDGIVSYADLCQNPSDTQTEDKIN